MLQYPQKITLCGFGGQGIILTAVMLGSTETTFYVVTVYFGSAGIRKTRYAIPAAMIADITGFLLSSVTVRLLF